MRHMNTRRLVGQSLKMAAGFALIASWTMEAIAMQHEPMRGPRTNSSLIDEDGMARVTRVIPVPQTISPEAQASLSRPASDAPSQETLQERRTHTDRWQEGAGAEFQKRYPVKVEKSSIAGVPVRIITPSQASADHVLINLHGGGFNSDSGSLTESIPIASLTGTKVIAVLYRLAPEHVFPAAVDDVIAVYQELLKTYRPANIAIYGTSAGAILTAETAGRAKQMNLPMPAGLGIFSGLGDFSRHGDSEAIFALGGFAGPLEVPSHKPRADSYVGTTSPKDPILSPVYSDLTGLPPTLFMTSTRDLLLSGTTILHRAFLRAKVPAELIVFEALPHAFWNDAHLPETKEANQLMADFFRKCLQLQPASAMQSSAPATSK